MNFKQYLEQTDGKVAEKWHNLKMLIPSLSEIESEIEAYANHMVVCNGTGQLPKPENTKTNTKMYKCVECGERVSGYMGRIGPTGVFICNNCLPF